MSNIGIYTITSPTNKVYVGQSWYLGKRKNVYKNIACFRQNRIYNSLKRYGWEAHKFEIVIELREDTTQEWLDYWETFFWNYYKEQGHKMLNIVKPGSHGKYSEEVKQAKKGKPVSQETRMKISKSLTGRVQPRDVVEKRKQSNKGYVTSEETKKKISESGKGKNLGEKSSVAVRVNQFTKSGEFIKEWGAMSVASRALGVKASHISACCIGSEGRKSAGGFIWKYSNQI